MGHVEEQARSSSSNSSNSSNSRNSNAHPSSQPGASATFHALVAQTFAANGNLHSALSLSSSPLGSSPSGKGSSTQIKYLRMVSRQILTLSLRPSDASNPLIHNLLSEILASCVLEPALACLAEPGNVNYWVRGIVDETEELDGEKEKKGKGGETELIFSRAPQTREPQTRKNQNPERLLLPPGLPPPFIPKYSTRTSSSTSAASTIDKDSGWKYFAGSLSSRSASLLLRDKPRGSFLLRSDVKDDDEEEDDDDDNAADNDGEGSFSFVLTFVNENNDNDGGNVDGGGPEADFSSMVSVAESRVTHSRLLAKFPSPNNTLGKNASDNKKLPDDNGKERKDVLATTPPSPPSSPPPSSSSPVTFSYSSRDPLYFHNIFPLSEKHPSLRGLIEAVGSTGAISLEGGGFSFESMSYDEGGGEEDEGGGGGGGGGDSTNPNTKTNPNLAGPSPACPGKARLGMASRAQADLAGPGQIGRPARKM